MSILVQKAAKHTVLTVLSTVFCLCASECDSFITHPELSLSSIRLCLSGQWPVSSFGLQNLLPHSEGQRLIAVTNEDFTSLTGDKKWYNRTCQCVGKHLKVTKLKCSVFAS